jgi:hypothetical protein
MDWINQQLEVRGMNRRQVDPPTRYGKRYFISPHLFFDFGRFMLDGTLSIWENLHIETPQPRCKGEPP